MPRMKAEDVQNKQLAPTVALNTVLKQESIQKRFKDILGSKAPAFMSSILSLTTAKRELQACAPNSIVSACAVAATLDLPINPNLGFAAIVPYSGSAQFQLMYKGLIQLAIRSGAYQRMNAFPLYEGELVSYNRITGDTVIDESKKKSDKVEAYGFYFRLTTGFEHTFIMSREAVVKHATKYSKAYSAKRKDSPWFNNFDAMALKTVTKLALSKYGILSVEMQKAMKYDQASVKGLDEEPEFTYPDAIDGDAVPVETEPANDEQANENNPS